MTTSALAQMLSSHLLMLDLFRIKAGPLHHSRAHIYVSITTVAEFHMAGHEVSVNVSQENSLQTSTIGTELLKSKQEGEIQLGC